MFTQPTRRATWQRASVEPMTRAHDHAARERIEAVAVEVDRSRVCRRAVPVVAVVSDVAASRDASSEFAGMPTSATRGPNAIVGAFASASPSPVLPGEKATTR